MEIPSSPEQLLRANSNTSATSTTTVVRPAELLAQLQPGQSLLAKVETVLANNQVELRIANQIVKADSPIQLAAGQPIKLLVEDSSNGLVLRIAQQASQVETLARAWRAALPKQQPIIEVVKNLVENFANNKTDTGDNKNVTNQLRSAIQTLVNNLPTVKTVSQAAGLRQAIQDSGVTLEAQLRKAIVTGNPPRTDNNIKANFLRLAQAALQIQANTSPGNVSATAQAISSSTGTNKSNPIDAYTSLLAAATKPAQSADKSLPTLRPLLPPLPLVPPDSASTTSPTSPTSPNRLTAALPAILQRLFSLPLTTATPQTQATASTVNAPQSPASQQVFSTMLVELLNQMESGLARIQQHQLSNITSDDAIRHFLNLELPVFNGKSFENIGVRFEWDKYQQEDDADTQHQWRVVLNFDFDELGKTQVIIRAGQDEIHTDFKSENIQAQALFEKNKNMLEQGLQKHGLTPGQFTFSTGHIDSELSNINDNSIIKTKA